MYITKLCVIGSHRLSREASQGRELTGGVLALRSLFSLSVNPCIRELPPTTITLLYKLCNWKMGISVFRLEWKAPTIFFPVFINKNIWTHAFLLKGNKSILIFCFFLFLSYIRLFYFLKYKLYNNTLVCISIYSETEGYEYKTYWVNLVFISQKIQNVPQYIAECIFF